MDAIILAAGLGTRLRPHTLTTPKPLLPVQGRPLMDWTLAALPPAINRLVVVVHYLAEQIEQYLNNQKHFGQFSIVNQDNPQGTGDALRRCREHVQSDRFLVLNGDDLFGAKDIAALAQHSAGLLASPVDEPEKFGIVFANRDGILEKLLEKPKDLSGPQLANTGAYVFPRSVFEIEIGLSERGEYEITDYIAQLARLQPFHIVEASYWFPIGTEEAWNQAQREDLAALTTAVPPSQ